MSKNLSELQISRNELIKATNAVFGAVQDCHAYAMCGNLKEFHQSWETLQSKLGVFLSVTYEIRNLNAPALINS